jgi:hypothetical protein
MKLGLFILTGILTSCVTANKYRQVQTQPLTADRLHEMNGKYSRDLWRTVGPLKKFEVGEFDSVRLTVLNTKLIRADLTRNGVIVASKNLPGFLEESGYYSVNRKVKVVPFIPIFWGFRQSKVDLTIDNTDHLYVANGYGGFIFFLFLAGGGPGGTSERFPRNR